MNKMSRNIGRPAIAIAAIAVVTGLIVGVVIASSGGDGAANDPVTTEELTPPSGSAGSNTTRNRDRSGSTGETGPSGNEQPAPDSGQPQSGGNAAPQAPEDSQQNDVPPPQGSPAERFEKFCSQNPGAC
jgi:hypothetical protein